MYNKNIFKQLAEDFLSIMNRETETEQIAFQLDNVLAGLYVCELPDDTDKFDAIIDIRNQVKNLGSNVDSDMLDLHDAEEILLELYAQCVRHYLVFSSKKNNVYDQMCDVVEELLISLSLSWLDAYDLIILVFTKQQTQLYLDDTDSLLDDIFAGHVISFNDIDVVCNQLDVYDADTLGQLLSEVTEDDINYVKQR